MVYSIGPTVRTAPRSSMRASVLVTTSIVKPERRTMPSTWSGPSSREPKIAASFLFAGTVASAAILLKQHGAGWSMITHASRRDVYLGLFSAFFGLLSAYSLFKAMSTGLVSLVYVIQAHYILIPIVLSVWWYKDHINLRKLAAVMVSFLAITLLYTG